MTFKQVPDMTTIENKTRYTLGFVLALLFASIVTFYLQSISLLTILGLYFLGHYWFDFSRRLQSDWIRNKHIVGKIAFTEDQLNIENLQQHIDFTDLKKIKFTYNYIRGKRFAKGDVINNGLARLNITTKSDEKHTIVFIIESLEQFDFLKILFKKWYQLGVEISERFTNEQLRTMCLERIDIMSYKELQIFKNELQPITGRNTNEVS